MSKYDEAPLMSVSCGPHPQTDWALVKDGRVHDVATTNNHEQGPFPDAPTFKPGGGAQANVGTWSLQCTGHPTAPGYLVDSQGNTTAPEGRRDVLAGTTPAYLGSDSVGEIKGEEAAIPAQLTEEETDAAE